jgi:hypothetical protein
MVVYLLPAAATVLHGKEGPDFSHSFSYERIEEL